MEKVLKIIPLGGLGEVGRNCILFEFKEKILVVDLGFKMPEEDMPGVDYVIPNVTYLEQNKDKIVGIIFTHGHYDHIGAIPYVLEKIWKPDLIFYASPLTRAMILKRQEDFPHLPKLNIQEVKPGDKIKFPYFNVEFFRQNHNIPDNLGLFIETPVGNIVHTSDFKFDQSPVNELPTDFEKLKEIGKRKILMLLSDSTSAEEKGYSLSESQIYTNLEEVISQAKGRVIASTFASLLNRIQQIITISEKFGRKVLIEGHSMKVNVELARALKYLKIKKGTLISPKDLESYSDWQITILCTGAQGEPDAVLMRIANKEHKYIKLKKGDTVIFSSSVIPGNERTVQMVKDEILRQGAKVFHYKMMDIHAGGHAREEELKEMIKIMNPKFLFPVHGQYSMLCAHRDIAIEYGIPEENIILAENGQIICVNENEWWIEKKRISANYVMVDGLGVGDVGEVVLRDRKILSKDGIFVIIVTIDKETGRVKTSPDIISRGFIYLRESKELLKEVRKKTIGIVNHAVGKRKIVNTAYIKNELRNQLGEFLFQKTQRRPMVLPVVIVV
jgi:ribonuclease J